MFLATHFLDLIYSEGFDEVTIPETKLIGVAMLVKVAVHARTMGEW